jgi:predicted transcriptional regulator
MDKFRFVKDDLKFLTNSEIRLKIINSIAKSSKSAKEIHIDTGLAYGSISLNLKNLANRNFLHSDFNGYQISNLTKILFAEINEFNKSINFLNKFSDFFKNHVIKDIDEEFLKDIIYLNESQIIESSSTEIYKIHNRLIESISNSEDIYAVITFIHPDYPDVFKNLINNGANLSLLISENICSNFIKLMGDELVEKAIIDKNLNVKKLREDIDVLLVGSPNFIYLGLFKEDNSFDQNRILFSNDEKAMKWGFKLFNKMFK